MYSKKTHIYKAFLNVIVELQHAHLNKHLYKANFCFLQLTVKPQITWKLRKISIFRKMAFSLLCVMLEGKRQPIYVSNNQKFLENIGGLFRCQIRHYHLFEFFGLWVKSVATFKEKKPFKHMKYRPRNGLKLRFWDQGVLEYPKPAISLYSVTALLFRKKLIVYSKSQNNVVAVKWREIQVCCTGKQRDWETRTKDQLVPKGQGKLSNWEPKSEK